MRKTRQYIGLQKPGRHNSLVCILVILICCSGERPADLPAERVQEIEVTTGLVIGLEDQPIEHQLGRPVAVRTDEAGNMYIADRASLTIKVFDRDGNYLKSLGGRGRGPGEFLEFTPNMMAITSERHFALLDRGQLEFKVISTEGEHINSFPVDLSSQLTQYYPRSVYYIDGQTIGLYLNAAMRSFSPLQERKLFHVYSSDFQTKIDSFFSYKQLGFQDIFVWSMIMVFPGSFTILEGEHQFIYAPGVYNGQLHLFERNNDGRWSYQKPVQGVEPTGEAFQIFHSDAQFSTVEEKPGAIKGSGMGEVKWGRLLSMDGGVFQFNDGRIAHFYAEWRDIARADSTVLDLSVQILNRQWEVQYSSYLFSMQPNRMPYRPLVDWKDKQDRFYLIEAPVESIPVVRRFRLELPD